MKVSVVMAVRNGERHIRSAIESVLAQSVTDFEFLIVDDASTDSTPAILHEYKQRDGRIRLIRHETCAGPYQSATRGLGAAMGDYIARHDADDLSPPNRLEIQLDACAAPDVALVTGAIDVFGNNRRRTGLLQPPAWQPRLEWELLFGNAVGGGGHVMFPRVFNGTAISFPCRRRYAEDYGLWCALSGVGRVACPSDVVYRYRQHDESITAHCRDEQERCLAEIRLGYQSRHLPTTIALSDSQAVSRFWTMGATLSASTARTAFRVLTDLQPRFIRYTAGRFGRDAAARLERELAAACVERLGYWMFRSLRHGDAAAAAALSTAARQRRQVRPSLHRAARECGAAFARHMRRDRPESAHVSGD